MKLGQASGASAYLQVGAGEKKTPGRKHELSLRDQITQKGQGKRGAKNSPRGLGQALLASTELQAGGSLTIWGPEVRRCFTGLHAMEAVDLRKAGCSVNVADAELGSSCV